MEQGMLSRHQEFGGTAWLALPGQDPALVRDLIDGFTEHMGPINVIERLWVRDIAILTARVEFLRKAQWAAVAWFTEQAAASAAGQAEGNGTDPSGLYQICTVKTYQNYITTTIGGTPISKVADGDPYQVQTCSDDNAGDRANAASSKEASQDEARPTDKCGNPLGINERNYPIPSGYRSVGQNGNRFVRDANGTIVPNPNYAAARASAQGVDATGVAKDLAIAGGAGAMNALRGRSNGFRPDTINVWSIGAAWLGVFGAAIAAANELPWDFDERGCPVE